MYVCINSYNISLVDRRGADAEAEAGLKDFRVVEPGVLEASLP